MNKRIPRKKGQPANSKKHSDLYTDENPKGTIHGLGFTDRAKAVQSINKIKGSGKTQEQIAEEMAAKFAEEDKNMAALQEGKVPQTEAEAKYLEDRMKSGEASEGEKRAFVAYQNVGGRTMDKIKDQAETARVIVSDPELAADAVQLGLGAVASSEIPLVSQLAGGINTLGYGARSLYYGAKGKGLKSGLYGTLAGGSALGMVPAAGAAAVT